MIIQAELKCKQTGCEADPCAVDKVIELPSQRFRLFSRALLADYDFIAENKNAVRRDDDARHCLLILDAEGTDGFLVDPQGYNYARYSPQCPVYGDPAKWKQPVRCDTGIADRCSGHLLPGTNTDAGTHKCT